MTRWTIGIAGLLVVLTSACASTPDKPASSSSKPRAAADKIDIVMVDDGIGSLAPPPGGENSCPGCSRWPTQFAARIKQVTGRETTVASYQARGVPEARELVSGDAAARRAIADAEVVVVATGAFNSLPDPDSGIGCPHVGAGEPTYTAWARTTKPSCLAEGIKTYGLLYDEVFAETKKLRAGKPTVYLVLTVADYNIGLGGADSLLGQVKGADRVWAKQFAVTANDRWNVMLGERAKASGFAVVDVYHAVNGPDGTTPAQLIPEGGHPNQAGHDAIAALLAGVDLSALTH